ncbi:MAG: DinB family protein [Dehalococcoidia bacterium]
MWDGPPAMQVSKADLLAHILLHERGHHGDVTSVLAQIRADPPAVDYLVYQFFKRQHE